MVVIMAVAHVLVIAAIAFQIYRSQTLNQWVFWPALSLKLLGGVGLGLIYTYYYTVADTFVYFDDALKTADLVRRDLSAYLSILFSGQPVEAYGLIMTEPRAFFFTQIVSFFTLLTNGNYWAIGFYMSFLSFLGSWFLVQVISRNMPDLSTAAVIGFLLVPSVVFWTSGVLKESVAMGALFFLAGLFLKFWFRERVVWWQIALGIVGFWILWNLKYYYAGVLLAVTITSLLCRAFLSRTGGLSPLLTSLVWVAVLLVPAILVTLTHPNFNIDRLLMVVVENNAAYNALSRPDNVVRFYELQPTVQSMLINAPWALFSGLFRPLLWEASSSVQVVAGIENTVLFVCFIAWLSRIKMPETPTYRLLVLSIVTYVAVLAVFLTLSAPNLGTLSRYRAGYICFFTFVILCNNPLILYVERSVARLVNK